MVTTPMLPLPQQHQYQPQFSFLLEAEAKGQGGLGNPEILTLTSMFYQRHRFASDMLPPVYVQQIGKPTY